METHPVTKVRTRGILAAQTVFATGIRAGEYPYDTTFI